MTSIATAIAKKAINDKVSSIKNKFTKKQGPEINWENFNYPPGLNLIHYDPTEIDNPHQSLVRKIHISFVLLVTCLFLFLINSIVQLSLGLEAMRLLYAFLNLFMLFPIGLFVFYRGYKGIVLNLDLRKGYKICQIILALLYLIFSIIDSGSFDGFVRVNFLFGVSDGGHTFAAILALIQSLLYLVNAILALYCAHQTHYFIEQPAKIRDDQP